MEGSGHFGVPLLGCKWYSTPEKIVLALHTQNSTWDSFSPKEQRPIGACSSQCVCVCVGSGWVVGTLAGHLADIWGHRRWSKQASQRWELRVELEWLPLASQGLSFLSLCCIPLLLPWWPPVPGASWLSWPSLHQTFWLQAPPAADDLAVLLVYISKTLVFLWDRNPFLYKNQLGAFSLHGRLEQNI